MVGITASSYEQRKEHGQKEQSFRARARKSERSGRSNKLPSATNENKGKLLPNNERKKITATKKMNAFSKGKSLPNNERKKITATNKNNVFAKGK